MRSKQAPQFSTNLLSGAYGGATVVYFQLHLAYYMGIREVYLIGIDFSFDVPHKTIGKTGHGEDIITHESEQNHFHPEYRKPGEKWTMPKLALQREAFSCARKVFEQNGGQLVNASRKTALDVLPITDFEKLF